MRQFQFTPALRRAALAAGLATVLGAGVALAAAPAADDGFKAFWGQFTAGLKKADPAAIKPMVQFPLHQGEQVSGAEAFAKTYKEVFGPDVRQCLAKAAPERDADPTGGATYMAFCGQAMFMFEQTDAGWRYTGTGASD